MAQIMCTDRLWKALSHARRLPVETTGAATESSVLGDWAATVARLRHHDLVLALNVTTWLTLVFPLSPRLRFRQNFVAALESLLDEHRQIARDVTVRECAEIELARIEHLSNDGLRTALDTVEFLCAIEMDYGEDLRRVQGSLNQFPLRKTEPCAPSDALLALCGASAAASFGRTGGSGKPAAGRRGPRA